MRTLCLERNFPKLCLLDFNLASNLYLDSIEKYGVRTNYVPSMAYAKTCEKGHFSKIPFHSNSSSYSSSFLVEVPLLRHLVQWFLSWTTGILWMDGKSRYAAGP